MDGEVRGSRALVAAAMQRLLRGGHVNFPADPSELPTLLLSTVGRGVFALSDLLTWFSSHTVPAGLAPSGSRAPFQNL